VKAVEIKSPTMPKQPTNHAEYQRDIYAAFAPPIQSTCPEQLQEQAKKTLTPEAWDYIDGSAALGVTQRTNREAFDKYPLIPRMLRNVTNRSTRITLFGKEYDSPIIAAPIGVQEIAHRDGETATAKACRAQNVPMILSTAATRTIEQIAEANADGERWYQLYWPKSDDITISLLNRAKAAGFTTLVVTLDTFTLGYRSRDLDRSYLPFLYQGQGIQIGLSDPVFNKELEALPPPTFEELKQLLRGKSPWLAAKILARAKSLRKSRAWLSEMNSGTYKSWDQLSLLRQNWDGPILLKGIQSIHDARLAIEHGMDGIIVSNHGGRQLSGAVASLDCLANICSDSAIISKLTILFDSGIRTGSDIIKAMALGANGILLGRPYIYGLAVNGQRGIEEVFKGIKADLELAMGQLGIGELTTEQLDGVLASKDKFGTIEKSKL
jgi:lactate 2-monooxygenase